MRHADQSQRPASGTHASSGLARWRFAAFALIAIALIAATVVGITLLGREGSSGHAKAAIVDQLSLTAPNQDFVRSATDTLAQAGYDVNYYPGEQVTVDLYRNLQTKGYDLIIFRAHTSRALGEQRGKYYNEAVLWTSEPYGTTALGLDEQGDPLLARVYLQEGAPPFTGIPANFVRSSMLGNFDGTTIIMMGCNGLTSETTAEAFLKRGTEAVIGWDGYVSSAHTDATTEELLELMVSEGLTAEAAAGEAATKAGADPEFGGELHALSGGS